MTSNGYGLYLPQAQPGLSDELHAERSYLLGSLQLENIKATELLRKLPTLEETLVRSQISHVKRRARKQIAWLKYRIEETTRQERTILNRLGQLAQEIQFRERWNQIESEQRYCGQPFIGPVVPCYEMQQMHFQPTTTNYQFQEFPFPNLQISLATPPEQQSETGGFSWPESFQDQVSGMPAEIWNPLSIEKCQHPPQSLHSENQTRAFAMTGFRKGTRMQRSSSMNDAMDVELLATHTPPVQPSRMERHHSTEGKATVQICSDKEDESSGSSQYSGYYINH